MLSLPTLGECTHSHALTIEEDMRHHLLLSSGEHSNELVGFGRECHSDTEVSVGGRHVVLWHGDVQFYVVSIGERSRGAQHQGR